MKEQIRCRACGYIEYASKKGEKCPACGLPASVFEPWKDPVSEKRRRLINLHLHPISVHYPQVLATLMVLLFLISFFMPVLRQELYAAVSIMGVLLPFTILGAMASGIFDGVTRFKKISTPHLIMKIALAVAALLFSLIIAGIILGPGFKGTFRYAVTTLLVAAIGVQVALSQIGIRLMYAEMPN
jgi:ribosomal protein L37E